MNATAVNMTSERPDKKKITRKLSSVNPKASNEAVTQFVRGLDSLSDNKLSNIEKVTKKDLEIPEVE